MQKIQQTAQILFKNYGIKRELARTQTALTSRVVNLTEVLNLKHLY